MARYDDDFYGRPTIPHRSRERHTIHTSRHIDICKNDADISSRFKDLNSFKSVCCLYRLKPRFFDEINAIIIKSGSSSTTRTTCFLNGTDCATKNPA